MFMRPLVASCLAFQSGVLCDFGEQLLRGWGVPAHQSSYLSFILIGHVLLRHSFGRYITFGYLHAEYLFSGVSIL
jgi:hypothetical protein